MSRETEYMEIQNELQKGISLCDSFEISELKTEAESHVPVPTRLADLETHIEREKERN